MEKGRIRPASLADALHPEKKRLTDEAPFKATPGCVPARDPRRRWAVTTAGSRILVDNGLGSGRTQETQLSARLVALLPRFTTAVGIGPLGSLDL